MTYKAHSQHSGDSLHIAHVIESLEFGGAEHVVVSLCNAAIDSGCRVTVILTKRRGQLASRLHPLVNIVCMSRPEGKDFTLSFALARIFKRFQIDVVHGHEWNLLVEVGVATLLAGSSFHLHTLHGHYTSYRPTFVNRIKFAIRRLGESLICLLGVKIVAVSQDIAKFARARMLFGASIVKIINGIKDIEYPPDVVNQEDSFKLLWVGRIAPVKGIKYLLEAVRQVSKYVDVRLTLVGDGESLNEIKARALELKLKNIVRFEGFQADTSRFYLKADCFIMSSLYEGISLAVLEAMRASLPVIATQVGGMNELVENGVNGVLVPPRDASSLAAAIQRLASDKKLRESMKVHSRKRFEQRFTESVMFSAYYSLYVDACRQ